MIPGATYRLQLRKGFGFAEAARLVPYLAELGISNCYLSPYLKARPGSLHGYDIVDHNELNPELGGWEAYRAFVAELRRHGMGHILDLVPNHMGVGGADNNWWLDVLENGRASPYAGFFDIDWHPAREALYNRVLVPILGNHYGKVLEGGELTLDFEPEQGSFAIRYHEHLLPLDPSSYPQLLERNIEHLTRELGESDIRLMEFMALTDAFRNLPQRNESEPVKLEERRRDQQVHKQHLARLCAEYPEIAAHLAGNLAELNGRPADFDALHRLLEEQAYRLAYWRVAADEINFRRFFDINHLAGLRQENPAVFEATHRLVLELVRSGLVDGLRLDHPDGLLDPAGYYQCLTAALEEACGIKSDGAPPCYLVAEKVLAPFEHLPEDWPLNGTTGYDFANQVNGLFVRPEAERVLERIYRRFVGQRIDFDDLVYRSKRLVMERLLFGELSTLGNLLDRVAARERATRDYTANGLRNALKELAACFPVYRTYIREGVVGEMDRRYVDIALIRAKRRSPAADTSVFDFIREILLERVCDPDPERRAEAALLAMRFQQYTAPVTAKALEDTSLYNYNRLLSLNDVGGDPRRFGLSPAEFHQLAQERLERWPGALLATSTHDSKRSEDVRARLNVLSEMPDEWRRRLGHWSRLNRRHHRWVDEAAAPSRNDEYLLYQTLLGSWPLEAQDAAGLAAYRVRIQAYMYKAVKEGKAHTSWISANRAYEEAVAYFVRRLLERPERNAFMRDFVPFARKVARLGLFNSLSQTLLKLTCPGVPDIYQGCELWDFSLVDPDNRRPVDFEQRQSFLKELASLDGSDADTLARKVAGDWQDGRIKLFLIRRLLAARRADPGLFEAGDYLPLTAEGRHAEHLVAFARQYKGRALIVVAPRWFANLYGESNDAQAIEDMWDETWIVLPEPLAAREWLNLLDGANLLATPVEAGARLPIAQLMRVFPVAAAVTGFVVSV